MGRESDRPPGFPGAAGDYPPPRAAFQPLVRTLPLRAVPMQIPSAPVPGAPASTDESATTSTLRGAHPPAPVQATPRPLIEEAPYVEVPTRLASMDDWPADHPAAALFRPQPPAASPATSVGSHRVSRSSSWPFWLAAVVAIGVGAGAAVLVFGRREPALVEEEVLSPRSPGQVGVASSSATPSTPLVPVPIAAPPEPPASAPPSTPSAPGVDPPVAPDGAPAPLLSFEAWLTVTSSADAEVVVQGVAAGRTNRPLKVRCGPRNVRLRSDDGAWLTPGRASALPCMQATTLEIEPTR